MVFAHLPRPLQRISRALLFPIYVLLLCEIMLRLFWHPDWMEAARAARAPIVMFALDPDLGWRNRPVQQVTPTEAGDIHYTIRSDSSRITSAAPATAKPKILVLGCSFTNGGMFLDDKDTYAWRMQERFPNYEVINLGTHAYGSYQSLLLLEERLRQGLKPAAVVFGLVNFHDARNVAALSWEAGLNSASEKPVRIPFALINERQELERHAPESYPSLPFDRFLVTSRFAELAYAAVRSRGRMEQSRLVTLATLREMQRLSKENNAVFVTAFLHAQSESPALYPKALLSQRIEFADCTLPENSLAKYQIPQDKHPNKDAHEYWANCITQSLKSRGIVGADPGTTAGEPSPPPRKPQRN